MTSALSVACSAPDPRRQHELDQAAELFRCAAGRLDMAARGIAVPVSGAVRLALDAINLAVRAEAREGREAAE